MLACRYADDPILDLAQNPFLQRLDICVDVDSASVATSAAIPAFMRTWWPILKTIPLLALRSAYGEFRLNVIHMMRNVGTESYSSIRIIPMQRSQLKELMTKPFLCGCASLKPVNNPVTSTKHHHPIIRKRKKLCGYLYMDASDLVRHLRTHSVGILCASYPTGSRSIFFAARRRRRLLHLGSFWFPSPSLAHRSSPHPSSALAGHAN